MKVSSKIAKIMLLLLLVTFSNTLTKAQSNKSDDVKNIVVNYLNTSEELTNYSLNGFTTRFTENFVSIPDDLEKELGENFPKYKFYIAKMLVSIDPPARKYDLIAVVNVQSKEVKGHIWAEYALIHPSRSFENILKNYQAKTKEDAVDKVKVIAKLIAFASNNDRIGNAKIQNGKVKVELIRGKGVFSIMELEINKYLQFNRLTFTEPNGKKLKYFV